MSLRLIVREKAESDIESAFRWYEEQRPGLGADFIRSVDAALASVQRDPELYQLVYRNARRVVLHFTDSRTPCSTSSRAMRSK